MHILLFILFFIIAIIVFGLSIVGFLLRTIFGIGRRSSYAGQRTPDGYYVDKNGVWDGRNKQ